VSLAVLVPTRCDEAEDVRVDHLLHSLVMQSLDNFRVIVRDEGRIGVFSARSVRQFVDLLARRRIPIEYHRVSEAKGVAAARRELAGWAADEQLLCFVDDDMCLAPDALHRLRDAMLRLPDAGFVQGQKIEADSGRSYWNDINRLNGCEVGSDPFRIWFGDAALLMIRREALDDVDWDLVTRYSLDGLAGEDLAMSVMIADRRPCYGVPTALAYHLSPRRTRWIWEAPSDVLQLELLRGRVSAETLRRALPHLADQI
jgi:hypothetical protein